ncbi:aromatic ring-hydroxylating dioxygenase subunit alpha [Nitrospirillum amazonense]|uniref:aromatic ring-hydroxylating dioxygenase subunit alpha n=1 Tax=Nitrospirillum amazonense TaxID=28077 RepID=UPI002412AF8F|nr:aromatic ring-hydroxylating dioxygenase subunit alpha [Nitrospirillum amazonense]MDG3442524.1 aromatic ring-hydroxylating dioxygenase subunit alpha [Nitrospirillum amazonense]
MGRDDRAQGEGQSWVTGRSLVSGAGASGPDTAAKAWPDNAWYAAAWDHEVGRALFPRTICGTQLVFYRQLDRTPVALADACWHRLVPLSKGRLVGDGVRCGYHGLEYAANGRCTHMPSQETLNPAACVRSYPVVERHRFLWVWMGDPALADPALVPDLHWNHDPEWAGDGRMMTVKCDYRLVLDNLMDLTHETFVHGSSIGNDAVAEAPFQVTHTDKTATVTRWMHGIDPPPFWAAQLGKPGKVDRWQIINFEAPCTIAIDVGVAPAGTGAPEGDRSQGVNGYVLNTITPEADGSCHYFWAFCRNYRLGEQRLTHELREGVHRIFGEDEEVLEAQQRAIESHPDRRFYNLNIDAGGMWARRLIDRMIAAERPQRAEAAE